MLTPDEKQRYSRHISLPEIGEVGQIKIKNAQVLVIGAGGLGCPVLLYLSAAGVGTLGVLDFDKVEISNLQRQLLYTTTQIGMSKVQCAATAIATINPFIKVIQHDVQISNQNALLLISDYDIVVDGTDNFTTRYLINDACFLLKKPLVYGAVHKFEGQVTVFHLKQASASYRSIYPHPPDPKTSPNCVESGVLGVLPGIIGSLQATEVLKIITGTGKPLDGEILHYNSLDQSMYKIQIPTDLDKLKQMQPSEKEFLEYDYGFGCQPLFIEKNYIVSAYELFNQPDKFRIIDIRELKEQPKLTTFSVEFWPLSTQNMRPVRFDNRPTLIICQTGMRSKTFVSNVLQINPHVDLYTLDGGVKSWILFEEKQGTDQIL